MPESWHGTFGNYVRVFAAVLLIVGIAARSVAADWRDVVEPELAGMVLNHVDGERVVIVEFVSETAPDAERLERAYTYTAGQAWNSGQLAIYRNELAPWCELVAGWSLRRLDHDIWERTSPYLAFAHAVVISCAIEDIPQIGQLSFVERILDGERDITFAHEPPAIIHESQESGSELAAWWGDPVDPAQIGERVSAQGWFFVEETSIDAVIRDPANELILAHEMPMRMTQELLLKGLYVLYPVEWNRDPEAPPWPLWLDVGLLRRHSGAMTRVQLLQMVDAALHADTDSITLCTAERPNEDTPLALLWAQIPQDGWAAASLGAVPGEAMPARLPVSASPTLNIAATLGTHADYVLVEWDVPRSSGMTEVLRSAPDDVTFSSIGMTSDNVFRDVTVETCVRYAYRVRCLAEDGVGIESELSRGYVGEVPETVPAIQATDGNEPNGIRVEWTPAEGATEYILYRCEPVNAPTQNSSKVYLVYRGPETQFLDTDVIVGTTYRYTAIPLNGCGTSAVGNPANQGYASHVELPNDTVVPPQWFRASLVSPDDHIELAWCLVPGADEYQVYRASAYAGLYEWVATTSTTAWRDDDAEYCQDYWYRIRTMSGDGVSQLSAVAHGVCGCKPGKPLEVGVSEGIYPDSIRIEWEAGERAQWTWVLRANEPDGPYTKIGQTEGCVYVDTGLVPGQQFWYRLEARNECGGSGWTSQIRGSTTPE